MYFLLNDHIFDIDANRMIQPLDAERFQALSPEYIALLGREMFAEDPQVHKRNPERARRLALLIHLKMPRINAAQFFVLKADGNPNSVDADFKSVNPDDVGALYQQQMAGMLSASKVDQEVWHRMAA